MAGNGKNDDIFTRETRLALRGGGPMELARHDLHILETIAGFGGYMYAIFGVSGVPPRFKALEAAGLRDGICGCRTDVEAAFDAGAIFLIGVP